MAIKRLALLGAAEGPWIDISRVQNPALRVQGLKAGIVEGFIRTKDDRNIRVFLGGDGQLPLSQNNPAWIQLKASAPTRSLVCEIVNEKVA